MGKSKKSKNQSMTSSTEEAGYGVAITSITKENEWSDSNPESVNTK